MKTFKSTLLSAILVMLLLGTSFAQTSDNYQAYHVHEDQVKPSMVVQYEKTAKSLADKMKEHNIQSTSWLATSTDNFRYLYVTPIKNMADLDKRPFTPLREKMGAEAFGALMSGFGPCYNIHGDYVIYMDKELTYMPNGITQTSEGEYFRKFIYIHMSPKNSSEMRDAMKAVKDLFANKNSTNYYRVYRSGFGTMGSYYMVAISAKDPVEMEQKGAANDKLLGDDAASVFGKILGLSLKFEEYTAKIRPELGYIPTKQ